MTPLAFDLLKDLTTRDAFRVAPRLDVGRTRRAAWTIVNEYKFFDLSGVQQLAQQSAVRMLSAYAESEGQRFNARLAFLPAPSTWLEMTEEDGERYAILLIGPDSTSECRTGSVWRDESGEWTITDLLSGETIPLVNSGKKPELLNPTLGAQFSIYAALALINTPRIIGRRQHMPHERIERDKLKALGLVGKFPLRAWTEIILKVALPDDRTGEPSTEAHLTGEKCLHFCRTHLRWCDGKLEYIPVEGHWRGNPALGMKRSRYRLEPEQNQSAKAKP